jgi:fimbrial chaperone protein
MTPIRMAHCAGPARSGASRPAFGLARTIALAAAFVLVTGSFASAATFSVNPTQIMLSAKTTSTLLTLSNESDEPIRFQLSAFGWTQTAGGEIELAPTREVVFFPALLMLGPKEQRRIRVGATVPAAAVERTYRIFVEELPPLQAPGAGAAVRVLTKMGVPIFLRPAKEAATAALNDLGLHAGSLHFTVANTGTVHFVPEQIKVRALGRDGKPVVERDLAAWYILAGGRREFDIALPAAECGRIASVAIDVGFSGTTLKETLQMPAGACAQ